MWHDFFLRFILKISTYYYTSTRPAVFSTLINKELGIFETRPKFFNKLKLASSVPLPCYHPYSRTGKLRIPSVFLYVACRTRSDSILMIPNKSCVSRIFLSLNKRLYIHKYNWI